MNINKIPKHLRQIALEKQALAKPKPTPAKLASQSLLAFTKYTMPDFRESWHHVVMTDFLDKFVRGDIKRAMIFAPPRHTKSELASRRLPAYIFGKRPTANIIACSYGASLARRMSRDVQRVIDNDLYRDVFPETNLNSKHVANSSKGNFIRTSDMFEIVNHGGTYVGTGIGGGITGMGMDYGIIDDPVKNRQDASSKTIQEAQWEWYMSTFHTRLSPNGGILIVLTRWSENDLAGRLLRLAETNPEADQWDVLSLPAICEHPISKYDQRNIGEALWESTYNLKELNKKKSSISAYEWSALYQQSPTPRQGGMFKREYLKTVSAVPAKFDKVVRYWDKASTKDGGDWTVGVLIGQVGMQYYIIDVVRGQWSTGARDAIILQTCKDDNLRYKGVVTYSEREGGSSGKDAGIAFVTMLRGYSAHTDTVTGSKETRAEPLSSQMEVGNVFMVEALWNKDFVEELISFPNGKHDDQVDACSGGFNMLMTRKKKNFTARAGLS